MNRRVFHFATVLLWLALPIVALQYHEAWDRLPGRMAVHFNAANQANGWMTREQSLNFNLWMIAIALVVSTIVLTAASWRSVAGFRWVLLGFFVVLLGFLLSVNQAVIDYNRYGTPIHPERVVVVLAVVVAALIATYLFSHRQMALPGGETLTVETHASRPWSALILIAMIGPIVAMALAPGAVRIPLLLVGTIGIFAFAMAWGGFQYRFLQHGVEIRMLGFRLRSIPRNPHRELCHRALGLHSRLRHSRHGRHARLCVVQQGSAHQDYQRRSLSWAQRSRTASFGIWIMMMGVVTSEVDCWIADIRVLILASS